jgi:hypothetical protein
VVDEDEDSGRKEGRKGRTRETEMKMKIENEDEKADEKTHTDRRYLPAQQLGGDSAACVDAPTRRETR